jgi:hypothetical protein
MGGVSILHWIIILGVVAVPGVIALAVVLSQRKR